MVQQSRKRNISLKLFSFVFVRQSSAFYSVSYCLPPPTASLWATSACDPCSTVPFHTPALCVSLRWPIKQIETLRLPCTFSRLLYRIPKQILHPTSTLLQSILYCCFINPIAQSIIVNLNISKYLLLNFHVLAISKALLLLFFLIQKSINMFYYIYKMKLFSFLFYSPTHKKVLLPSKYWIGWKIVKLRTYLCLMDWKSFKTF